MKKFQCQVCNELFDTEKGMHVHLKKHKIDLATYYTTYYPRKNLLTGDPLPFKNKDDYFSKDFSTRSQLIKWCKTEEEAIVKKYIIKKLQERVDSKKLKMGPNYLELKLAQLPDTETYKKFFGSYSVACKKVGVEPLFGSK